MEPRDTPPAEPARLGRRVRIWCGDDLLVDTDDALRVIEDPHEVRYYAPVDAVAPGVLQAPRAVPDHDGRGPATLWTVVAGGRTVPDGAWSYAVPVAGRPDLRGAVSFAWPAMDRMREEDQDVSVHPRNPFVRLDALASTRRVRVEADGRLLAETCAPVLLVETHQPPRWYLPRDAVAVPLTPSATRTECPYKGLARYWSVADAAVGGDDLAWSYPDPTDPAALPVAGHLAFDARRVDAFVDGRLLPVPAAQRPPRHLVGDWVRRAVGPRA
jgi:uncharacterized protein (DUF427 family)